MEHCGCESDSRPGPRAWDMLSRMVGNKDMMVMEVGVKTPTPRAANATARNLTAALRPHSHASRAGCCGSCGTRRSLNGARLLFSRDEAASVAAAGMWRRPPQERRPLRVGGYGGDAGRSATEGLLPTAPDGCRTDRDGPSQDLAWNIAILQRLALRNPQDLKRLVHAIAVFWLVAASAFFKHATGIIMKDLSAEFGEEAGEWQRSLELFLEVGRRDLESTSVGHNYALSACRQGKRWRHGFEIMMAKRDFEPDFRLKQDLEAQSRGLERAPLPEPSSRTTPSPEGTTSGSGSSSSGSSASRTDKRRQEERRLEEERLRREQEQQEKREKREFDKSGKAPEPSTWVVKKGLPEGEGDDMFTLKAGTTLETMRKAAEESTPAAWASPTGRRRAQVVPQAQRQRLHAVDQVPTEA
ncbi:unnamed protein product [Prorocentrum cordatum]|uniref:Uncharacterized protein n=1 Tax=Prorocentrum cordatum TaxID=2364126 RepID=A0ABN9WHD3_9DINO|nr:unnamed protein product [Polarella glacialis]